MNQSDIDVNDFFNFKFDIPNVTIDLLYIALYHNLYNTFYQFFYCLLFTNFVLFICIKMHCVSKCILKLDYIQFKKESIICIFKLTPPPRQIVFSAKYYYFQILLQLCVFHCTFYYYLYSCIEVILYY